MIRTTISFLALGVSLFVASRLIHESLAAEKPRLQAAVPRHDVSRTNPEAGLFEPEQAPALLALNPPIHAARPGDSHRDTPDSAAAKADRQDRFANSTETSAPEKPARPSETLTLTSPANLPDGRAAATNSLRIPRELDNTTDPPADAPASPPPSSTDVELSPELISLRENVRSCLAYYYNRLDNVAEHSPWGVMHILIAYGVDTKVIANGRAVNGIGWLCWNGTCRGQRLFEIRNGRLQTHIGPGVQGHDGQFLAMMAQSRVQSNYPMRVDGRDLTIADLIEHEKLTCHSGMELTFKLIGLAHYLDSEAEWKNEDGETWNIARLIKEELAQNVIGAACGGTHRMMGFSYAVQKREREGKPLTGQWKRAKTFVNDYFDYTFYLQNGDGSFSTDFFRGRNDYGDINRRIETTGHILEWFVASLPGEMLRDPRVVKSVQYLTRLMMDNRNHDWEIGPRGHALHALAIYSERVFRDRPGQRDAVLARGQSDQAPHRQR